MDTPTVSRPQHNRRHMLKSLWPCFHSQPPLQIIYIFKFPISTRSSIALRIA